MSGFSPNFDDFDNYRNQALDRIPDSAWIAVGSATWTSGASQDAIDGFLGTYDMCQEYFVG